MLVTKSAFSHICKFNCTLRACIHKPVAADGVKLGSGNDLGQLLHICRLDVNNVETLVLDVQVPEVDSQIITTYEGLSIAVDRDAVDVIGMGIRVCASRNRGDNGIMVRHTWQSQLPRVSKVG